MIRLPLRRTSHLLALATAAIVTGVGATSASAGVLTPSAQNCPDQVLSQPFKAWLDPAWYTPAPDGGLEEGGGQWGMEGARVVGGNEPWQVAGDGGTHALQIQPGGSATTRAMCVGIEHPTLRFFARQTQSGLLHSLSTLRVDVLYENHLGLLQVLPIGLVNGSTSWNLTPTYLVVANLLPLLPGDRTPVAFRFTPQGTSAWQVDDVFVDPYRSN